MWDREKKVRTHERREKQLQLKHMFSPTIGGENGEGGGGEKEEERTQRITGGDTVPNV